ncbi:MAG: DUF2304 domain-containing protein [Chloroflexi bacterium]|jgi:hypothetical protein|nr:DUF2304 domain-containing protein [Chloroflexota bacterium]
MSLRARLFFIAVGIAILLFVINLVRTRRLKEEYALLWLVMAGGLVISPLFTDVVEVISYAVGIDYPPALLFVMVLAISFGIIVHFSVTISRFSDQIKTLSQDLALTRKRVQELEERASGGPSSDSRDKA